MQEEPPAGPIRFTLWPSPAAAQPICPDTGSGKFNVKQFPIVMLTSVATARKLPFVEADQNGMRIGVPEGIRTPDPRFGKSTASTSPSGGKAKARLKAGANVGVRLRDTDLVIDVDPRHFAEGDDPVARLKADFRLPDAPFVRTGGGGRHHYYRKPVDVAVGAGLSSAPWMMPSLRIA